MFSSIAGFFSQSYLPRSIWCTGVTTSQSKYQDVKTEERKTHVSLANYLHVLKFLKLKYIKELVCYCSHLATFAKSFATKTSMDLFYPNGLVPPVQ